MKHDQIVSQLVLAAQRDPNIASHLLFGYVAAGTHRQDSDVDVITILMNNNPAWGA
jgi:predicted nucleotidyltransferase